MDEPVTERMSELTAIADLLGDHHRRFAWPPAAFAPGIVLRRRKQVVRDPVTQEPTAARVYLVPFVEDPVAFYRGIAARGKRPGDAHVCRACNGARYVRSEVPQSHPAFGQRTVCPRWSGKDQRCVEPEPYQPPGWAR